MANIIINPADVIDFETPLYRQDNDNNKVYKLLPETKASQVKTVSGANVETELNALRTGTSNAASAANIAMDKADSAYLSLVQVNNALANKAGTETATSSANGLMSAADKVKLNGIEAGAQVNPDLSGYVQKVGATMTGDLAINNLAPAINFLRNGFTYGNTYGSNFYEAVNFKDANGLLMARLEYLHDIYKGNYLNLVAYRYTDPANPATKQETKITLGIDSLGNVHSTAPAPADASNNTTMATTAWTRARIAAATGQAATAFSTGMDNPGIMTLDLNENPSCAWSASMITPDMRNAANMALKNSVSEAIFAGFSYELNSEEYFFTYDLYDQQNIADNAILAITDPESVVAIYARNEYGKMIKTTISSTEAKNLHRYASINHKKAIMADGYIKRQILDACSTYSQLEYELETMGLLLSYEAILAENEIVDM